MGTLDYMTSGFTGSLGLPPGSSRYNSPTVSNSSGRLSYRHGMQPFGSAPASRSHSRSSSGAYTSSSLEDLGDNEYTGGSSGDGILRPQSDHYTEQTGAPWTSSAMSRLPSTQGDINNSSTFMMRPHSPGAYSELEQRHNIAVDELRTVRHQNTVLLAKLDTLRDAYTILVNSKPDGLSNALHLANPLDLPIPTAPLAPPPSQSRLPPLHQSDYPLVRYWRKRDWTAEKQNLSVTDPDQKPGARGAVRASNGENVMMQYVETENGHMVDGFRASDIKFVARRIWAEMAVELQGNVPLKWKNVGIKGADRYARDMALHCPELRLCDSDWKAHQIATDTYPSWKHTYIKNRNQQTSSPPEDDQAMKIEPSSVAMDNAPSISRAASKRPSPDALDAHPTAGPKRAMLEYAAVLGVRLATVAT
ncbi:hypothetical protein PLICRDRAFT_174607 [Plicaturopsis crispa FD-325 SS-3]|nr:hypothetical protein PLICRDRAFT_174607 [Plicaturopsis crispa FD-325 SS-3]